MALTVTHSTITGAAANSNYLVDGPKWDANHTLTGSVAASEITSGAALTRTNDTNVTLTLGGTPTTALLAATSVTVGWSGTLAIARGGTGAATASAAFDALAPTTTRGDLIFRNATTNARLAAGTSGYALIAAGAGADPAWTGFLQSGTGAVTRTWQDKAKDFRTVKDYGATGDGTTDDYAALVLARDAAIAAGTAMIWTSGTYCISQTLELGYEKLEMIPLGKVTIKHTGTGVAVSFNGIANYPGTQGAAGILFGGPNRFFIEGNASTTNLVLIDNIHFSDIRFAGKNATNAILLLQDNGAVALASAVETLFDVLITPNSSGTFSTTPLYGIHATRAAACIFERPIIETVGSSSTAGIHLIDCVGNEFNGGTIESCNGGGIYLNSGCSRNTFVGVHNEFNGALHDWNIAGDHNTFIGCAGAGTTSGQTISGDRNLFIGGKWESATVTAAGNGNRFENCQFVTAFTDSGSNTTVINPDSIATAALKLPAADIWLEANQAVRFGGDAAIGGDGSSFVRLGTASARAARILAGTSEWKLFASGGMSNTGTDRGAGTLDLTGALYDNGTAPTGTAGTGYVRATSPTLTTPTIGVATATSINKMAITAPATSSTLAVADGKTATISNTLTFTGTDTSTVACGAGGTVLYSSAWTTPTFSAGSYTANGSMTWTVAAGDVTTMKYIVVGKTMHIAFSVITTTVGGTPDAELRIAIPGSYLPASRTANLCFLNDNGTRAVGWVETVAASNTYLSIKRLDGANFSAATDATAVFGEITFEVQ